MTADSPPPRDQTTGEDDAALDVWREGDRTVIGLYGEYDLSTEAELTGALASFCGVGGVGDVIVDLSQITFVDSTTITALLGARNLMLRQNRRLILRAPSAHARRILQLCGLLVFLEPTETTSDQGRSNGQHGPRSYAVPSLRDCCARHAQASARPGSAWTVAADKAYGTAGFVADCRGLGITPHVAQNTTNRRSAIDGRTTRHAGHRISQRIRARIEEPFGWIKTIAGGHKLRYRGRQRNRAWLLFAGATYNLIRITALDTA